MLKWGVYVKLFFLICAVWLSDFVVTLTMGGENSVFSMFDSAAANITPKIQGDENRKLKEMLDSVSNLPVFHPEGWHGIESDTQNGIFVVCRYNAAFPLWEINLS